MFINIRFTYNQKPNVYGLRYWNLDLGKAPPLYLPSPESARLLWLQPIEFLVFDGKEFTSYEEVTKEDKSHWFIYSAANLIAMFRKYDELAEMLEMKPLFKFSLKGKAS